MPQTNDTKAYLLTKMVIKTPMKLSTKVLHTNVALLMNDHVDFPFLMKSNRYIILSRVYYTYFDVVKGVLVLSLMFLTVE